MSEHKVTDAELERIAAVRRRRQELQAEYLAAQGMTLADLRRMAFENGDEYLAQVDTMTRYVREKLEAEGPVDIA